MRPLKARRSFHRRMFLLSLTPQTVVLTCEICNRNIPSDMPWVCHSCGGVHAQVRLFSYLYRCRFCFAVPSAVQCPGCHAINFLDRRRSPEKPATQFTPPPILAVESVEAKRQREKEEKEHQRISLQQDLLIAKLEEELNEVRLRTYPPAPKAPKDILKESFEDHMEAHTTALQIVEKAKARIEKKWGHDRQMKKLLAEAADHWLATRSIS